MRYSKVVRYTPLVLAVGVAMAYLDLYLLTYFTIGLLMTTRYSGTLG